MRDGSTYRAARRKQAKAIGRDWREMPFAELKLKSNKKNKAHIIVRAVPTLKEPNNVD